MRAAPAAIGGMPRSSKRAERAAIGDQLALALHHVDRHRGLAVLEGGELLRARHRDRRVARDDLLDQAAHRLEAERQRNHVEQQPVVARRRGCRRARSPASPRPARPPCPDRGWSAASGRRTRHRLLHVRHARRAADHARRRRCLAASSLASRSALRQAASVFCDQRLRHLRELAAGQVGRRTTSPVDSTALTRISGSADSRSFASRALTISSARVAAPTSGSSCACSTSQQNTRWSKSSPPSAESPPVASTSNTPLRQPQDRNVEGAAAQVVDRIDAFGSRGRARRRSPRRSARSASAARSGRPAARRPWSPGAARRRNRRARLSPRRPDRRRARLGALAQHLQDLGRYLDRDSTPAPADLRMPGTIPGASTKSYGMLSMCATSARPRPMKRLTETIVLRGIDRLLLRAPRSRLRRAVRRDSARSTAAATAPRASSIPPGCRCAPSRPANSWCRDRCRPRAGAGVESVDSPGSEICSSAIRTAPRVDGRGFPRRSSLHWAKFAKNCYFDDEGELPWPP